ncbi:hypothetical protein EW093_04430 [Thiospirochaeta perfilievii]|uniref:Glycosyl hydrolase family 13 catalytic domain-containing protein n=1 Tax=Thiospirochaeta perfilievii TaxID=252967 RepID=A0A5C1Q953_9SPIO|nr:alpha-amylase family glycosyl hydrolase [Thiospirochaeta perfilievii]QEN03977.1 hypothetical protein EW093_04430 [Thiospirochaeta perfilievii]
MKLGKERLGATLNSDGSATLRVWSPSATELFVQIYNKSNSDKIISPEVEMIRGENGFWEITLNRVNCNIENLDGYYYQYKIITNGKVTYGLDPYAKSMAAFSPDGEDKIGKAAIIDINSKSAGIKPISIGKNKLESPMEMISYEVHIRDFTIGTDEPHSGTFKGFSSFKKGIEHLKELGITHVQLLPIQSFYTVNEKDKSISLEGVGHNTNYNWGYDPHNYFSPDGWYSTDPDDPYSRIREFRELVTTLHNNGIGVIMDVVYNHTYQNFIFHNIAESEYYRKEGGTEPVSDPAFASEKPMARELIVDSLKYFVDEFGIDGFRFDLMGFIDNQTMKKAREVLGNNIILYGEAWNYTDLEPGKAPVKGITNIEHHEVYDLAYFNDTSRDSYAGRMDNPGFVQGVFSENPRCKAGIIGGIKDFDNSGFYVDIDTDPYNRFAINPDETLQYLSIHDGFTLWDKINISHKGDKSDKLKAVKQAIAMLFTSQGKIAIHGGSEIARTKPLSSNDAEPHRINKNSENVYDEGFGVHFHENSYRSPDYTNMYRWERKDDPDYSKLYNYFKGLIKLRRSIPCLRYQSSNNIRKGLIFFGDTYTQNGVNSFIAYTLDNSLESGGKTDFKKLIVIHNAGSEVLNLKCDDILNPNDWSIIVDGSSAGVYPIINSDVKIQNNIVSVPSNTSTVLAK